MSRQATQRTVNDLQVAYLYCLSNFGHLGDRSALKLSKLFPTYQSWFELTPLERQEILRTALGNNSHGDIATKFDALMDRAVADVKDHERQGIRILSIDSND